MRKNVFAFGLSVLIGFALLATASPVAYGQSNYPKTFLKSSPKLLKLFEPVIVKPKQSTVRIECKGRTVAFGTVVGADGLILTVASELEGTPTVHLPDGRELEGTVAAQEEKHNLALVKIDANGLTPIDWRPSKEAPVGSWAVSVGTDSVPAALGVISVGMRKLSYPKGFKPGSKSDKGYLGINLDPVGKEAIVERVLPGSGAAKAGMKKGDIIILAAGKDVKSLEDLRAVLKDYKPKETIEVRVRREDKELDLKVTLGKAPKSRGEIQNNMGEVKLSKVRTGFPVILQHDSVIKPDECGGPLVDLEGKAIGINISRAGRTESYAIPTEAILPLLEEMLAGKHEPASQKSEKTSN